MISSVRLQHFRSYADETFEFEPGVNIVVGPNGSGKTNLLEGILVLATGSSYRAGDLELIKFGEEWARLDANAASGQRTVKLQVDQDKVKKSYIFDEKPFKLLNRAHTLPVVLFEPNHLLLLHGQPDARRNYLDNLLEQLLPGFTITRRHYRRVLAQRNALLKSPKRPSKDQLFVWNLRLSELGGVIANERVKMVGSLETTLPESYKDISGAKKTKVAIRYESKLPLSQYESGLLKGLDQSYEKDLARGFTGYGPHRDDFTVTFDGRPASEVASRGETRTALLAFKVHELQLLEQQSGQKPLLLFDDVFSELDGKRRHALASFLRTHQTFITTTDADLVLDEHMKDSHIIPVQKQP